MNPGFTRSSGLSCACWFASIVLFDFTYGQSQPSPQPEGRSGLGNAAEKEQTIALPSFEISTAKDRGYAAASTLAGARISTNLKDTPAVIGVLTGEFFDDVLGVDLRDLGNWGVSLNMNNDALDDSVRNRELVRLRVRGILASNTSRNYFASAITSDSFSVERLEIPRGPNAILYGAGPLGGLLTANTKRARFGPSIGEVRAQTDSWGGFRSTADFGRSLGEKLAVRVNLLAARNEGWRDADFSDRDGVQAAVVYRPLKKTEVRLDAEWGQIRKNGDEFRYTDQSSNWNGTTVATSSNVGAAGTGTSRVAANVDYLLWNQNMPQLGLLDWRNTAQTTGRGWVILPPEYPNEIYHPSLTRFPQLPSRRYTLGAKHPSNEFEYLTVSGFLEQKVGNKLVLEFAANYETREARWEQERHNQHFLDLNPTLPNGQANPFFGEAFDDSVVERRQEPGWDYEYRFTAAYPLDLAFTQQRIVVMAGLRDSRADTRAYRQVRINNPAATNFQAAVNRIATRRYWRNALQTSYSPAQSGNGIEIADRLSSLSSSTSQFKYWQALATGSYFKEKVHSVVGYRYDRYEQDTGNSFSTSNDWRVNGVRAGDTLPALTTSANPVLMDPSGLPTRVWSSERLDLVRPNDPYDPVKNPRFNELFPLSDAVSSISAGFVWFPIEPLGAFFNVSEGFLVGNGQPKIDHTPWDPPRNKGLDVGLKLELWGGRLSGTLSYYRSSQQGGVTGGIGTNIRTLWSNAQVAYENSAAAIQSTNASLAQTYRERADKARQEYGLIAENYADFRDTRANGYELDIVANLNNNWRLMANVALPEVKTFQNQRDLKAYVSRHQAVWDAYLADTTGIPANSQRTAITSQLSTIASTIGTAIDGRAEGGNTKYVANFFTTYRISSGILRNLRAGGGAQMRGKRITGTLPKTYGVNPANGRTELYVTSQTEFKETDSFYLVTAMAAYNLRRWGVNWNLQVNVSNLLDEDKIIPTSFQDLVYADSTGQMRGMQVPNAFNYNEPRRVTFSIGTEF